MPGTTKDLDLRILRELTSPGSFQWNFRESYSAIGKRLGADEETVRLTLQRSMKLGLIEKWRLILNPDLFNCQLAGMQVEVGDVRAKSRMISQVRLIDGVVQIIDFHGPTLRVVAYFEDKSTLRRKKELVRSICGHEGKVPFWVSKLPHCKLKLSRLDWRIIQQLMHDPRKDVGEVASQIEMSRRTVNRRLRRITEGNVAYLIPVRNVRNVKGTLCSYLIFVSEKGRNAIHEFLRAQPLRVDFIHDSTEHVLILTLMTDNLTQANDLREKLASIAGVSEVKMSLLNELIFVDEWLDEAVSRMSSTSS